MTRAEYHEYLASLQWKAVADAVKLRAGLRCQLCNDPDRLEAHHRSYKYLGNDAEHLEELICLCRKCHRKHHNLPPEFDDVPKASPVPLKLTPRKRPANKGRGSPYRAMLRSTRRVARYFQSTGRPMPKHTRALREIRHFMVRARITNDSLMGMARASEAWQDLMRLLEDSVTHLTHETTATD